MIDPSIITRQKEIYVDIDVVHGPSYGETLFWDTGAEVPPYDRKATVQFDVDTKKLYDLYIKLMTQPPRDREIAREPWKWIRGETRHHAPPIRDVNGSDLAAGALTNSCFGTTRTSAIANCPPSNRLLSASHYRHRSWSGRCLCSAAGHAFARIED